MKFGFIGIGNMGSAMLKGADTKLGKDQLMYTDVSVDVMERIKEETGIDYVTGNVELVQNVNVVILAVKPQYLNGVLEEIADYVNEEHIMISIAPGITIDHIKKMLGSDTRVIRSMPNTPALVLEGMSAYTFSKDNFGDEEVTAVKGFFESFGRAVEVTENQLDMVVPVSGSSPAYGFIMIEAMADAGVLCGLPRKTAYELAAQTMLGTAKMVLESGKHPGELKDAVCSPGGTTIEAVKVLEEKGFRGAVIDAMVACYDKTKAFK